MNLITPIVLILVSLGAFFGYVDPNYRGVDATGATRSVQSLQAEDADYQSALADSNKIIQKRDVLIAQKNTFSDDQISRLQKLLPDNVDNVRLIIDINNIAASQGLSIKNIKIDTTAGNGGQVGADNKKYSTIGLSFSVNATYINFSNLLSRLEESLRLVDITDLSVSANDNGFNDYSVTLKTYWLK